jgi:hypothetical protein
VVGGQPTPNRCTETLINLNRCLLGPSHRFLPPRLSGARFGEQSPRIIATNARPINIIEDDFDAPGREESRPPIGRLITQIEHENAQ